MLFKMDSDSCDVRSLLLFIHKIKNSILKTNFCLFCFQISNYSCDSSEYSDIYRRTNAVDHPIRNLKTFAKEKLKNRIFFGKYREKRYVDKLNVYKDVIVLNKSEKILCDDIIEVHRRIQNFYESSQINDSGINVSGNDDNHKKVNDYWFGFGDCREIDSTPNFCIWTNLEAIFGTNETIPFGQYWFQIKNVKFNDNHIEIQLKILRPANDLSSSNDPIVYDTFNIVDSIQDGIQHIDWKELFRSWARTIHQTIYKFCFEQITKENLFEFVKFTGLLIMLVLTGSVHLIKGFGEFALRFIQESTKFMKVITPILLTIVNTLGKMVGGFYILIAMMWRDAWGRSSTPNRSNYNNQLMIDNRPYKSPYARSQRNVYSGNQKSPFY